MSKVKAFKLFLHRQAWLQTSKPILKTCLKLNYRTTYEQELARRTIVILVTTRKLLTMTELLDALATRISCDDYSTKRIPSQDAIRQLCGSFLTIDSAPAKTTQSAIVKLSHKSVQDFFLLRHDLVPPDHLAKYFVDRSSAHREMGRTCLTYLSFKRYESPDGLPESFEIDPEHAFLRYTSVFWFQHLDMRGVACEEMRQEIRTFLQSYAFWTAFRDKPGNGTLSRDDLEILHHLQRFIMEWHEALTSGMDALLLCQMDLAASGSFPGRAKFLDKTIKRVALGPRALEPRSGLSGSLNSRLDFQFRHVGSFESLPAVDPPGMHSICQHKLDIAARTVDGEQSYPLLKRLVNECLSTTPQGWQLVNEVRVASGQTGKVNVACHFTRVQRSSQSMARLRGPVGDTGPRSGESAGDNHQSEYDKEEEQDEEYDEEEFDEEEEDSESERGSETEESSSGIESSTDATEPESDTVTDVLVIIREEGNPIWIPCHGNQKTRRQMGGSLHPSEPVFVWAQDAENLSIMNTVSGKTTTSSLPELPKGDGPFLPQAQLVDKEQIPNLRTHFGSRVLTEIRFSSDGSLLYALLVNFEAASSHVTKATVSLVKFRFEAGGDDGTGEVRLEQSGDVLTTAYHFHKKMNDLPVPLGVTYWCSDAVYICLPLLTCSVKFIRMPLSPLASDKSQSKPQPKIQTLNRTILIPSSTSQRRPRLLYQSSTSKSKPDDSLYLVLDPEPKLATPTPAEDRHHRQDTFCSDHCDHEDMTTCDHRQEEFGRGGASVISMASPHLQASYKAL
ncbi:hypothetical protein QBC45DRAFT_394017 [Copromyces sp. CBS 386.78]|nr:hypothetical protein QBC45DRAFT_394017 [Copromyces sp. CBS 386.78]